MDPENVFPIEILYWRKAVQLDAAPHLHSFYQLEICRSGRMNGIGGPTIRPLEAGDFWLIPPEQPHSFCSMGGPVSFFTIKFRLGRPLNPDGDPRNPAARYHADAIRRLLESAHDDLPLDALTSRLVADHLWALCCTLAVSRPAAATGESAFLLKLKEEIAHRGARTNVGALAEWTGLSPARFKTRFRRDTGGATNIKQFIDRLLVKIAIGHLLYSPHSLTEIARIMNFSTIYAFSRFFKQRTGRSPQAYRRDHRHETPRVGPASLRSRVPPAAAPDAPETPG